MGSNSMCFLTKKSSLWIPKSLWKYRKATGAYVLLSILSTFYSKLLRAKITKVHKDTDDLTVIFLLLGSERIVAARKMLVKLTPEGELRVWVCRRLLTSVAREKGGFDCHEVLHQQITLLKFGQTGRKQWKMLKL